MPERNKQTDRENLDERIKHCMVHVNPVDIDLLENEFSDREEQ